MRLLSLIALLATSFVLIIPIVTCVRAVVTGPDWSGRGLTTFRQSLLFYLGSYLCPSNV